MIRFTSADADTWISNRQNNGQFDYWFVITRLDWEGFKDGKEVDFHYNVEISVVAPSQVPQETLQSACDTCGVPVGDVASDQAKVAVLTQDGVEVPIWSANGNNLRTLFHQAKQQAKECVASFKEFMDRTVNKMGTTGWEALRGADPRETLNRIMQNNPTPEQKVLAKMYGM